MIRFIQAKVSKYTLIALSEKQNIYMFGILTTNSEEAYFKAPIYFHSFSNLPVCTTPILFYQILSNL